MSFIARYFRKNPYSTDEKDKIDENDINAFIERKIEESINLDYKHIEKYTDKIDLDSFHNRSGILSLCSSNTPKSDLNSKIKQMKEGEKKDAK